ncbi:hypothetical protein B0T25DRAFT_365998 [Lasiosphaeria hispida]|uniref:Heterokaryon incompatibility domain-containing protein n=1 Tax=Lasiosphaeria hispida TaxID=260671 RepID=A0AAJ0H5H3_9PEZI|nr:hypothetical protein B0T25DRAFT_365998 [Lasiosphaeria hispida]
MDAIYQGANFTIVTADGNNADASLLGVVPVSREMMQHTVRTLDGCVLPNVLPDFGLTVNDSHWNKRGWTYQERVLSSRKVYFSSAQLLLECPHGVNREDDLLDCHDQGKGSASVNLPQLGLDMGDRYQIMQSGRLNLLIYEGIVHEYSMRDLTYEEDFLDAFQGRAAVLKRELFRNSPILDGVPVSMLDAGVIWRPSQGLQRRHRRTNTHEQKQWFPSWSDGMDGRYSL